MQRSFRWSIFLTSAMLCTASVLSAQTIQVNSNNRTIAITVADKAAAEPDLATVHVGFEIYAPTAEEAYSTGSGISNRIVNALKHAGIDEKTIESEGQSLRQNMQFDPKESDADRAKKQFVLTQSWMVKTTADDAGKVLHTAIEAGANTSGQIDWDLKDREGLRAQAAAKALVHARAMAEQMAKGLNASLGALMYASNSEPQPIGTAGGYGGGRMMGYNYLAQKVAPLAIRPQKIEESATVYAVFAIQ
jgi:uncharacterized protein YggE